MIGTKSGTTISARLEGKQYSARQIWVDDVHMYAPPAIRYPPPHTRTVLLQPVRLFPTSGCAHVEGI